MDRASKKLISELSQWNLLIAPAISRASGDKGLSEARNSGTSRAMFAGGLSSRFLFLVSSQS